MLKKLFGSLSGWGPMPLRLAAGAIFIAHGAQKLFGAFGGSGLRGFSGMLEGMGLQPAMGWAVLVACVEFFGGICLVLGILTRWSALLLGVVMLVAIFGVHLKEGFFGMEYQLTLLAACVSLILTGPGRGSLQKCKVCDRP